MATENIVFIASDGLLQATEITDTITGDVVNTATITVSIFEGDTFAPASMLAFTSGGVLPIEVGDIITDDAVPGTITAIVQKVTLSSGSWAAGNAAGQLELVPLSQNGVFIAGNIDVTATQVNIATIPAGDSTGLDAVLLGGGQIQIPCTTIGLLATDYIYVESTKEYNGQFDIDAIAAANEGYVTITAANVAELFTGEEQIYKGIINGKDLAFAHGALADGVYHGIQPEELEGIYEGKSYYLIEKIVYGGYTVRHRYKWVAGYYSNLKVGT